MSSIAFKRHGAALALLFTVLPVTAGSTTPVRLRDPFAKLTFDPARTRFDAAPADLAKRCGDLSNGNYDRRLFVFARTPSPKGELLAVAGQLVAKRPDLKETVDDVGALVRLSPGGGCDMIGPAAEPFGDAEGYAPQVSGAELAALSTDAARRYVAAYRGAPALCAAMVRQHVRIGALAPLLARAFVKAAPCLSRRR